MTLPVHGSIKAQLARTKAFKITKYGTKDEVMNVAGEYQWQFYILAVGEYSIEKIPVRMWSKDDPISGSSMGDSVELAGCVVAIGFMPKEEGDDKRSRKFWTLSADSLSLRKAS